MQSHDIKREKASVRDVYARYLDGASLNGSGMAQKGADTGDRRLALVLGLGHAEQESGGATGDARNRIG